MIRTPPAVAESLAGKSLSLSKRLAVLLLLFLFAPAPTTTTSAEEGGDPPPPPLDISGEWNVTRVENCHGHLAGVMVYTGSVPDLETFLTDRKLQLQLLEACGPIRRDGSSEFTPHTQWIFQDCLETTFIGRKLVHHIVNNNNYTGSDFMYGIPVDWQSEIEPPNEEEALDGATAVMVGYNILPTGERDGGNVRRYINSEGQYVIKRDMVMSIPDKPFSTTATYFYEKLSDIPGCHGYDPDVCADRVYTDTPTNWTVACCENQGGDDYIDSIISYPRPPDYDCQRAPGNVDCVVPP